MLVWFVLPKITNKNIPVFAFPTEPQRRPTSEIDPNRKIVGVKVRKMRDWARFGEGEGLIWICLGSNGSDNCHVRRFIQFGQLNLFEPFRIIQMFWFSRGRIWCAQSSVRGGAEKSPPLRTLTHTHAYVNWHRCYLTDNTKKTGLSIDHSFTHC